MDLEYLIENWREVVALAIDHLRLSLGAVALALLVALPLGVLAARVRRLTLPTLSVLGLLYTVPSLALSMRLRTIGMSANTGSSSVMCALSQTKPLFIISSE